MTSLFVGRHHELEILDRCLSHAHSGSGMVVLISGAPRIGKSSLLDALCVRAEARSFRVLRAHRAPRYLPGDDSPWPYVIPHLIASAPQSAIEPQLPTACPTFTGVADANKEGGLPLDKCLESLLGLRRDDSARSRSFQCLFEIAPRARPLLLTVDDLHNGDEPLLALLQIASQSFNNLPVMLVAAYSSPGTSVRSLDRSAVESIGRHARHLELPELEPGASAKLLRQVAGNAFDEVAVRQVHNLTGGNPGLILDMASACLRQAGANSSNPLRVKIPSAIRVVVEERLAVLSLEARGLLGIASAIGNTFAPQLLLSLVPLATKDALDALCESEAAGLIRSVGRDGYRFVMGFVKKVLYEEFPSTTRASLHRQIAAVLHARSSHGIESHAGDVALHLLASRDADAIQKALEYAEMGARHSARARDYHGAVIMYSIALEALDLTNPPDELRRGDFLIALGEAQTYAGDVSGAQDSLRQAAEIAQMLGDGSRLAEIVLAAPVPDWPFPGSPNSFVTILAENALDSLPERDVTRRALVMARLAAELSNVHHQRERSEQLVGRALEIAKDPGSDRSLMLRVMRLRDFLLRRPELAHERLANGMEITRLARQRGDWIALFEGEWAREISLFQLGAIDSADAELESLEHAAIMAGPRYRCLMLAFRAIRAIFDGRFAKGEELFDSCREMAMACGLRELPDQLWTAMLMPLHEQGRLAELESVAARWSRTYSNSASLRAMRCWLALRLGRTAEARFHLERLAADGFAALEASRGLLVEAAALTEVCTELGDVPHHAAVLYQLLLPHNQRNSVLETSAAFGAVSRYLGKLALSLSHIEEAIAHLESAATFNNRMGARAWAAHASHELAVALLARGRAEDRRRALELLANAHSEAASMGMERLARSIRAGVDRIEIAEADFIVERDFIHSSTHYAGANNTLTGSTQARRGLSAPPNFAEPAPAEADLPVVVQRAQSAPNTAVFRLEEEYWTAGYVGKTIRLKRLKGLNLIAYLLSRPHEEVHVLELSRIGDPGANGTAEDGNYTADGSDLGPILDHSAKQAYHQRIQELREESEEARSFNDLERAAKIDEEICLIARELARAVGLGGRDRKIGSPAERARLRVTNAIRWATGKISSQHPTLGRFLDRNIKTGTFCSYSPDPNDCPHWDL